MSYMREPAYAYVAGPDPDLCDEDIRKCPAHSTMHIHYEGEFIALPLWLFDELVVMRDAELREDPHAHRHAVSGTLSNQAGNFGCFALLRSTGVDPEAGLHQWLREMTGDGPSSESGV